MTESGYVSLPRLECDHGCVSCPATKEFSGLNVLAKLDVYQWEGCGSMEGRDSVNDVRDVREIILPGFAPSIEI